MANDVTIRWIKLDSVTELGTRGSLEVFSLAWLEELAEAMGRYPDAQLESFENTLLEWWQTFNLLEDVTVNFLPEFILIKTEHIGSSKQLFEILINDRGWRAIQFRNRAELRSIGYQEFYDSEDWHARVSRLQINMLRKVRP